MKKSTMNQILIRDSMNKICDVKVLILYYLVEIKKNFNNLNLKILMQNKILNKKILFRILNRFC